MDKLVCEIFDDNNGKKLTPMCTRCNTNNSLWYIKAPENSYRPEEEGFIFCDKCDMVLRSMAESLVSEHQSTPEYKREI